MLCATSVIDVMKVLSKVSQYFLSLDLIKRSILGLVYEPLGEVVKSIKNNDLSRT